MPGASAPGHEAEHIFRGFSPYHARAKAPENFAYRFPGAKAPGNVRQIRLSFPGAKAPGNVHQIRLSKSLITALMPYVAVWIHAVWATHQRQQLLSSTLRPLVFQHLREQAERHQIRLTDIGGWTDHVHILFALKPDQTLAKVLQLLKGESSHWINQKGLIPAKLFSWQSEYWAGSVSPSGLARVRAYIAGQEEHHRSHSFAEECDLLFKGLGIASADSAKPGVG